MSAAAPLLRPLAAERSGAAAAVACDHCGLPVPAGLIETGTPLQFCCTGCRAVYEVLYSSGLENYYRIRESLAAEAHPAQPTGRRFEEYDDPAFHALYVQTSPAGEQSAELFLEGVHCGACVWLVEKLPMLVPGLRECNLNLRSARVRLAWTAQQTRLSDIARGLDRLGYPPHPARDVDARQARRNEEHRFLVRIAVAGAAAGNVMLMALALYAGMFGGMQASFETFFRWLSMGVGLVSLTWPGSLFFRGAWASLRTRTPHLDLPIALGLGVGALSGIVNTIRGSGEIYFDSLTVLVFLLLVGRWIQYRQQRWSADTVELLFSLTPTAARRIEANGTVHEVSIDAIRPGDRLEIRAGDTFPADGTIELGDSLVDRSLLSGESQPVPVAPGTVVHAGVTNLSAAVHMRAEATGSATRVARLMQLVDEGLRRRAPIVRFADRIAGWFVGVVIALAGLTILVGCADLARAVDRATALLIVTCPCALGLATPLAMTVAIGRAARRKILIKGADALERLARPGQLMLDKTGTLTRGRISLVRWRGDDAARSIVHAVEQQSSHPIAKALVAALADFARPHAVRVEPVRAAGLLAIVDGRAVRIGSPAFVLGQASAMDLHAYGDRGTQGAVGQAGASPEWTNRELASITGEGLTPILVSIDGAIVAAAGLGDALRADARDALATLQGAGWHASVLSGDHPDVVRRVAQQVGIDPSLAIGAATPEEKLQAVQAARRRGPVVMIGDGINDAPALSAATVGIAVHGSAEASLASADIYLASPGLTPIVDLVLAGRRTLAAIRRCLFVSLAYNILAGGLAITGLINPLIAAILMPLSSLSVLALAYSARTFEEQPALQMQASTPAASAVATEERAAGKQPFEARDAVEIGKGALECP